MYNGSLMLPTLDSVSSRVTAWRSASLPKKSAQGFIAAVAAVLFWPLMVGLAYAMVVRSRLQSPNSGKVLVGAMVVAALVAQGAWSQWMIASAMSNPTGVANTSGKTPTPTPNFGSVAGSSTPSGSTMEAEVVRVVTGSYLEVMIMEQLYQVQLIGLKAPDPGSSSSPPACYGQESKNYLQGLLSNNRVLLATDEQLPDRDDVGVMLRYAVGPDGSILNRQMLDAGMVEEAGSGGYTQKVSFLGAQEAAKVAKRGMWGTCYGAALPSATTSTPTPTPTVSSAISKAINPIVPTPTPTKKSTPTPTPTHTPTPTPTATPTPTPTPSP